MNVIKMAKMIGIHSYISPFFEPLVLGLSWNPAVEESDGGQPSFSEVNVTTEMVNSNNTDELSL